MTDGHCFISYSTADAMDFARRLADELEGGEDRFTDVWFDKRNIDPARDWDEQIVEGIKSCKSMAFVMTRDSTASTSMCKNEWTWALKYKKIIIPIRLHKDAEQPFGLGNRQWIDFSDNFEHGLAKLRKFLREMDSPKGILQSMQDRLADAERALRRAKGDEEKRIQVEIEELKKQIEVQQNIVDNPKAAEAQTQKNIEAGLERERKPQLPLAAIQSTKFINPPPGFAPTYFQDRTVETKQVIDFLHDDSQRLMTIVGRGGVGKTAMICRLLKHLENGAVPEDVLKAFKEIKPIKVDGIVYLSESGSHRVNFANVFYDLCKLLPAETAQELDAIYKNPQASTTSKTHALLEKFTSGHVVLLLDNFEPVVDTETFEIKDAELNEALIAFLNGIHTSVKIVITTRIAPKKLNLIQGGRQRPLNLDDGLESPYAENILREMDSDGRLGLKSAGAEALNRARIKTRGFPRALEALFAILASDRYTTLEELLVLPLPENVVEALVGEAFNRLDTNAQKVMQALAVYNRPVTPAAVDYLLAPHIPAMDSAPILQRLANMHFARKESGRFYLHPVDREFAFGLIATSDQESVTRNQESLVTNRLIPNQLFTQHDLTSRAADYFAQARKPRAEWKKLEDLSAQLAEFDLRCAAGDYDSAASVLTDIDFDYLLLWGHYRLMIQMHRNLAGKIKDTWLKSNNLANLGLAYMYIGEARKSIEYLEQAVELDRINKDKQGEGADLDNLGLAYASLGNVHKAIEYHDKALAIAREIGERRGEGNRLGNLGNAYFYYLGETKKGIEYYEQALTVHGEIGDRSGECSNLDNYGYALIDLNEYRNSIEKFKSAISIADEINKQQTQSIARCGLAQAYLFQNDLVNARVTIEAALGYDVPQYNHNASTLHGIIALRQRDEVVARGAFLSAIGQADEILSKTAEYYDALDAKGLALCGLAICDGGRGDPSMPTKTNDGKTVPPDITNVNAGRVAPTVEDAIETFRKARKIAPHAGVIKSVLRLFDELVKCEGGEILKDVRKAVEGVE